jgi:carbon storage regulator
VLVLSRKKNETIVIDENIEVTIVSVHGDRVSLGIQAPRTIPVHRSELHRKIAGKSTSQTKKNSVDS